MCKGLENIKKIPALYIFILLLPLLSIIINISEKSLEAIFYKKSTIEATLLKKPEIYKKQMYRTLVALEKVNNVKTKGNIILNIYNYKNNLNKNDKIILTSKIIKFKNFKNPNNFKYKEYMYSKGIYGYSYTHSNNIKIVARHKNKNGFIDNFKKNFSLLLEKNIKDKNTKSVLKALTIGEKEGLSKELKTSFIKTGSGHLLAISGLHIGIVGYFFFILSLFFLKHISILRNYAILKKLSFFISAFPICLYSIISGLSPPTQRATIMALFFIFGFIFEKEQNILNIFFLSAIIILLINPYSIFSISFQFSYIAVFFIIFGIKRLRLKNSTPSLIKRYLYIFLNFMIVSLLAILSTLPLGIYYFHSFSTIGLLSNIILVPLIGFISLPCAILSLFFSALSSYISIFFMTISGFFIKLAINFILFLSNFNFVKVTSFIPTPLEIVLFYLIFILIITILKNRSRKKIITLSILLALLFIDISFWTYQRYFNPSLRISIIDVKNGSSSLIELPNSSESILIDGGGFANSNFDVGESVVAPFLLGKKIKTIETIILTHPDSDHLNGLIYILENFNVKNVISNNEMSSNKNYLKFLEIIKAKKINHLDFSNIKRDYYKNGVHFEIIHPQRNFLKNNKYKITNNNSIVLKLSYKNNSILFTGDIEKKAEKEIERLNGKKIKSTILIAPHHGSNTSSSTSFLKKVAPKVIIVSSAKDFKRSRKGVQKRYNKIKSKVYLTDKNGAIFIQFNNKKKFYISTFL